MRVNIYAEEMTDRVEIVGKEIDGHTFTGLRFYLELPVTKNGRNISGPFIHRPGDDDSAAVTFWGKQDLRVLIDIARERLDEHYSSRGHAPPTAVDQSGDPVAWMFDRRYGSGLSFKRPADYEDAEGNIVRPTPLYTIGGQGHVAAARCSDRSIASSEATCLNAGPSARIGTDIQHGKLDADAGSIPAPPSTSPDPIPSDDLVARLRSSFANGDLEAIDQAVAAIVALQARCDELERVNAAMLTHMESFRIVVKERDETIGRLQKSHTEAWNLSVKDQGRAERAEAEVAKLRRVVETAKEMRTGNDCPMCDSGKLRNAAKEHWDSCAFSAFDAALKELDAP